MANRRDELKDRRMAKFEARIAYTGTWAVEMCDAPTTRPLFCLTSVLCPVCVAYHLRHQALRGDMRRYSCCQGYHCVQPGCFHEESCPEVCLLLESSLCFANSVLSTRSLVQDEMVIGNTSCDETLIGIVVAIEELACICRCAAGLSGNQELHDLAVFTTVAADNVYCSVCACMQTQHKVQLDARDSGSYALPLATMVAPMQMQMQMQPVAYAQQPQMQMQPQMGNMYGQPQMMPQMQPGGMYAQPQYMQPGGPAAYGQPVMGIPAHVQQQQQQQMPQSQQRL